MKIAMDTNAASLIIDGTAPDPINRLRRKA
jgi:hypothetical protein